MLHVEHNEIGVFHQLVEACEVFLVFGIGDSRGIERCVNSVVLCYLKKFCDEVELEFQEDAYAEIARIAKEQNTGARGLRAILEGFLQKVMYETPDRRDVKKVIITKSVVLGEGTPKLVLRRKKTEALPTGEQEKIS